MEGLQARIGNTFAELSIAEPDAALATERILPYAMSMQSSLTADCFVVECEARRYFVKLHHDELPAARDAYGVAAGRAAAAGIAPSFIGYSAANHASVFECAPPGWRAVKRADFDHEKVRGRALAAIRQLHSLDLLPTVRPVWDVLDRTFMAIDEYVASTRSGHDYLMPHDHPKLVETYACLKAVAAGAAAPSVLLHGEVLASNMLIGPNRQVMLVDFDGAANGDPLWDFAALALAFDVEDEALSAFAASCGVDFGSTAVERLQAFMVMQDIGWGLWGRLAHFISPRKEIEFFKYGETRLARARGRLESQLGALQ